MTNSAPPYTLKRKMLPKDKDDLDSETKWFFLEMWMGLRCVSSQGFIWCHERDVEVACPQMALPLALAC